MFEYYPYIFSLADFFFFFLLDNMTATLSSGSGYKDLPLFHTKRFVMTLINAGCKRKEKKRNLEHLQCEGSSVL